MNIKQPEAQKKKAKKIIERLDKMQSARRQFENHWQECLDYIIPRKAEVTSTRVPGEKRGQELYDATPIVTNQHLSGALHGMLTNPATRFFELRFKDPNLDEDTEVKKWLQEVGNKMFTVLNNTNFQTEIHEIYLDLGAIGTACMYMGESEENYIHFSARAIKEVFVEENNEGRIDTVYRCFKWKIRQIVQEFGEDNLPPELQEQYRKGSNEDFEIIHAVEPAASYDLAPGEKAPFPIKSCYVLKDHNAILSEKGFHEFPYAVPRWTKTSGEVYGRGPGMDLLPDIKMLNKMMETTLQGAQMTVTPPIAVDDDGVVGTVQLKPRGITVVRAGSNIKPLLPDARVDFGYQAVEDVRKRIRAGFFVDQLNLAQNDRMTTLEVQQRIQENLRFMGPILGRQHNEFLRPVIDRLFGIMVRRELLPPAPPQIQGKKFDVEYSSQVARAQRMSEGQNFTQAITLIQPIASADPSVLDNIDSDEVLKYAFDIMGIPAKILRTEQSVMEIRKGREAATAKIAQERSQMHEADMAQKVAPGVAAIAQAQARAGK